MYLTKVYNNFIYNIYMADYEGRYGKTVFSSVSGLNGYNYLVKGHGRIEPRDNPININKSVNIRCFNNELSKIPIIKLVTYANIGDGAVCRNDTDINICTGFLNMNSSYNYSEKKKMRNYNPRIYTHKFPNILISHMGTGISRYPSGIYKCTGEIWLPGSSNIGSIEELPNGKINKGERFTLDFLIDKIKRYHCGLIKDGKAMPDVPIYIHLLSCLGYKIDQLEELKKTDEEIIKTIIKNINTTPGKKYVLDEIVKYMRNIPASQSKNLADAESALLLNSKSELWRGLPDIWYKSYKKAYNRIKNFGLEITILKKIQEQEESGEFPYRELLHKSPQSYIKPDAGGGASAKPRTHLKDEGGYGGGYSGQPPPQGGKRTKQKRTKQKRTKRKRKYTKQKKKIKKKIKTTKKNKCGGGWAHFTKRTAKYRERLEKEKERKNERKKKGIEKKIKEIKKTTSATSLNPLFETTYPKVWKGDQKSHPTSKTYSLGSAYTQPQ